jgi:tRNA (cmo5U34)-methyltransferase
MNGMFGMLSMLIREHLVAGDLQRKPEDLLVMDSQDQVSAWHAQGAADGPIVPVYHLNALACSKLAPVGGTVVDLGCGSGQFAAYLSRRRPDLKIVGFDLSAPMVAVGNAAIAGAGLADRVELRVGDMTAFSQLIPSETALVSCVFAVHHLPVLDDVGRCFAELKIARNRNGCSLWIFDLARPRHASTAYAYPQVLTPDAPEVFKLDSTNSLLAAYSHAELTQVAESVLGVRNFHATLARLFPLYQAFWVEGARRGSESLVSRPLDGEIAASALRQYRALRLIMPALPA